MTREEAIEWLTDIKCVTENWAQEVAIDMAIEALQDRPTDEENQLKFYYVESIDDYWVGRRLDNFYYAEWDGIRFVWSHSRYLPWGEHVVDENTLWKEHTYPSEPIEMPFTQWIIGFMKKYSAEPKTGMWISKELANMICNEICYYKEVTVDTDSLNDLCEGCLIKKKKYGRPTGEWIKSNILPNGWHCSHCDAPVMTDDISEMLFCPNCGTRMYKGGESDG